MKTAVLIQAHKDCNYILDLAKNNPNVNFYIHFDLKSKVDLVYYNMENLFSLSKRVSVFWGGFSQVQATLNLLEEALNNTENQFFHLISGEDVFLKNFHQIESEISIEYPEIYMDFRYSQVHRYRTRFNAIHSDSSWQRTLLGKIFTKGNLLLDKIFPLLSNSKFMSVYGSSWFSINRIALEKIMKVISKDDLLFFKKKLCPDEHFFQYIIEKNNLHSYIVSGNKRYIDLPDDKNHPRYLDLNELLLLSKQPYWAARKVTDIVAMEFSRNFYD